MTNQELAAELFAAQIADNWPEDLNYLRPRIERAIELALDEKDAEIAQLRTQLRKIQMQNLANRYAEIIDAGVWGDG